MSIRLFLNGFSLTMTWSYALVQRKVFGHQQFDNVIHNRILQTYSFSLERKATQLHKYNSNLVGFLPVAFDIN